MYNNSAVARDSALSRGVSGYAPQGNFWKIRLDSSTIGGETHPRIRDSSDVQKVGNISLSSVRSLSDSPFHYLRLSLGLTTLNELAPGL